MPGPEATIYWAALRLALEDYMDLLQRSGFSVEESIDDLEAHYLGQAQANIETYAHLRPPVEPVAWTPEVGDEVDAGGRHGQVVEIRKNGYVVVSFDDGDEIISFEPKELRKLDTPPST